MFLMSEGISLSLIIDEWTDLTNKVFKINLDIFFI